MKPYMQEVDIRWSDLDANMHLANSSYMNITSHTRLKYFVEQGYGYQIMVKQRISPVIFHEHIHFYKEVLPGAQVFVTMELKGRSEDGMLFEFAHNVYSPSGEHHCYTELMGAFINIDTRKLTSLTDEASEKLYGGLTKTPDFSILTKADTRKFNRKPQNRPDLFE